MADKKQRAGQRKWDFYVAGGTESPQGGPELVLRAADLCDPASIEPRQWLYGTQLLRSFVTVLVAPGGTGKTAYAMVVAAALASGLNLLGEHVFERMNVAVLNLEDPMEELNRRLAAIRIRYDLGEEDLAGRYFMHSGEDRPITMAAFDGEGFDVIAPDEDALVKQVLSNNIGLLIVDPFAESHSLEENSNPQMVQAAAAWRRVARRTKCAILLVHHVRKGPTDTIDSARGAKALTDSARIGLLLAPMTEQDAADLGVPEAERTSYVRLSDAKANMAPRASKARWFKHCRINLGNARSNYPNGDWVGAVEVWEPPSLWEKVPQTDSDIVLDRIAAGLPGGSRFTDSKRHPGTRWAGKVLVEVCGLNETQAATVLKTWISNGVLVQEEYYDAGQRKKLLGLTVNDAKRPGVGL